MTCKDSPFSIKISNKVFYNIATKSNHHNQSPKNNNPCPQAATKPAKAPPPANAKIHSLSPTSRTSSSQLSTQPISARRLSASTCSSCSIKIVRERKRPLLLNRYPPVWTGSRNRLRKSNNMRGRLD